MSHLVITILTSSCIFLIIYHHIAYPLLLKNLRPKTLNNENKPNTRDYKTHQNDAALPTITLVIPAYNEQRWITEKILNTAILDYPKSKLEVIIACDGCTDDTANIARKIAKFPECKDLNITIVERIINIGKVEIINNTIPESSSDLIALSDASAIVSIDALLIAAHNFLMPDIGVVNSNYQFTDHQGRCENTYWKYQAHIKTSEASLGSTLGAHGAFYVIRRSLFEPLPKDTINDDFVLPMCIVAKGYRAVQENKIVALELESSTPVMDFQRRIRISRGNIQQLIMLRSLLSFRHKGVCFTFASGKALRVIMPLLLFTSMAGSTLLAQHSPIFFILMLCQITAYLIALHSTLSSKPCGNRLYSLITYIVRGHTATLIGTFQFITSKKQTHEYN